MNSTTAVFDRRVPVGRQPAVPSVRPGVPQIGRVLDIIRGARSERRRTIKGVLYHVALCTDASGKDMHFIFGSGSWTTAPEDEPLKACAELKPLDHCA